MRHRPALARAAAAAGLALSTLAAAPAHAALKAGDAAPLFTAPASLDGRSFEYALATGLKKGPVVVYFYPSAYTSGCNIQAHEFATHIDDFTAAGASVVGVSLDSIARLNKFSADPDYCAGKLPVASDADGHIAKSYELRVIPRIPFVKDSRDQPIDHGFAERTTFIVGVDGRIVATVGGVAPDVNVRQSLERVRQLAHGTPPH
ncbi:MAG: peroxiredoxin [Burkholderiales bacterium]|nr:peroxiredoxin [Burkholderiales bacterium]MDE1929071.1 peroxiredoxin [Burkholderiales bacterium]MDE2158874.1 peroxiredoxin [Burkholderiales bacterium]MDE2501494.1 peroxiredoxin [Burkholderiales bacterium]